MVDVYLNNHVSRDTCFYNYRNQCIVAEYQMFHNEIKMESERGSYGCKVYTQIKNMNLLSVYMYVHS